MQVKTPRQIPIMGVANQFDFQIIAAYDVNIGQPGNQFTPCRQEGTGGYLEMLEVAAHMNAEGDGCVYEVADALGHVLPRLKFEGDVAKIMEDMPILSVGRFEVGQGTAEAYWCQVYGASLGRNRYGGSSAFLVDVTEEKLKLINERLISDADSPGIVSMVGFADMVEAAVYSACEAVLVTVKPIL